MQAIKEGSIVTATYKGKTTLKWVNREVVAIEYDGSPIIKGNEDCSYVALKPHLYTIELVKE